MIELEFRNKRFEVKSDIAARDALKKIGIEPESVLLVVNGKLTTDDVILREGDKVKLVAVVSGGGTIWDARGIICEAESRGVTSI